MTREKLEREFEKLYEEAQAVLKEFNPCNHKTIKGNHHCEGKGNPDDKELIRTEFDRPQCCCRGCQFWTDKGCGADKPLTCRTWLCVAAANKNVEAFRKLDAIKERAIALNLYWPRQDKKFHLDSGMFMWESKEKTRAYKKLLKMA